MKQPTLTERDHHNLDAFLGHLLDAHKNGELSREAAAGALAHVIAAVDQDNYPEARRWFEEGRKYIDEWESTARSAGA